MESTNLELTKHELEVIMSWYQFVKNEGFQLELDEHIVKKLKKELFFMQENFKREVFSMKK